MRKYKVVVVTGSNKNIGFEIVRAIANKRLKPPFGNKTILRIYLACRNKEAAEKAIEKLEQEYCSLLPSKKDPAAPEKIEFRYLRYDLDDLYSINQAGIQIAEENDGMLDLLVCNAGWSWPNPAEFGEHVAKATIKTNYFGTLETYKAFIPLLKFGTDRGQKILEKCFVEVQGLNPTYKARLITVSSMSGGLKGHDKLGEQGAIVKNKFLSACENADFGELTALVKEFEKACYNGDIYYEGSYDKSKGKSSAEKWKCCEEAVERQGWRKNSYGTVKSAITAMSNIAARINPDIFIASCCPGSVRTDMSKFKGLLDPKDGCDTPQFLCNEDLQWLMENNYHGAFVRVRKIRDWEEDGIKAEMRPELETEARWKGFKSWFVTANAREWTN